MRGTAIANRVIAAIVTHKKSLTIRQVFVSLCAALAVLGTGRVRADALPRAAADLDRGDSTHARAIAAGAGQPIFRLGTAAGPFGWSTAIGDFNKDGRPDLVVADHVGRRAGAYAYRLEFSLSGTAPSDVFFESTADALTISTVDIDHDDDLDIVAGRPFDGGAVGVWLNDGHGHFTQADVRRFPSFIAAHDTVGAADPRRETIAIDTTPRPQQSRLAALRAGAHDSRDRTVFATSRLLPPSFSARSSSPRAPPLN